MGGRAGCEAVIWRHFDGATDKIDVLERRRDGCPLRCALVHVVVPTYIRTDGMMYARVRWAVSLVKERTAVLNAGGGEKDVGKRLEPVW